MYGLPLLPDDEQVAMKDSKGNLTYYKRYDGPKYGGVIMKVIAFCPNCGTAQGMLCSTESPHFLQFNTSPEWIIRSGKFVHQKCSYPILKKEISNDKGNKQQC